MNKINNFDDAIIKIREYEQILKDAKVPNVIYFTQVIDGKIEPTDDANYSYSKEEIIERANKYAEYLKFAYKVDEIAVGNYSDNYKVKVCDTPKWMENVGFNELPVYYSSWHIFNAMQEKNLEKHTHGIDINKIKALPYQLENYPALLLDNISNKDSLLGVINQVDCDNIPLFISILPNGKIGEKLESLEIKEIETNNILTCFGNENFDKYINNNYKKEDYIYINEYGVNELRKQTGMTISDYENLGITTGEILKTPNCIKNRLNKELDLESANNSIINDINKGIKR